MVPEDGDLGAEGDDRVDHEGREGREDRGRQVEELLSAAEPEVLLEDELRGVGDGLEEPEGAVDVGPGAGLHAGQAAALHPQDHDDGQDEEGQQEDGLEQREPPGLPAEVGCDAPARGDGQRRRGEDE